MAVTITYKDEPIVTFSDDIKVLNTAGTWTEDNITVEEDNTGLYNVDQIAQHDFSGDLVLTIDNMNSVIENYAFANSKITSLSIPGKIGQIKGYAFFACTQLLTAEILQCQTINDRTFSNCTNLRRAKLPQVRNVTGYTFYGCTKLEQICMPMLGYTGNGRTGADIAQNCTALTAMDYGYLKTIDANAFKNCQNFDTLILRRTDIPCTISNINAFTSTKFDNPNYTGKIYVPQSLINTYSGLAVWTDLLDPGLNNQILSIEDSPYQNYYIDGSPVTEP